MAPALVAPLPATPAPAAPAPVTPLPVAPASVPPLVTASSSPPGVPRRRASAASSSPLTPTIALGGTPSASSACMRLVGIGPTSPTIALAAAPSGEERVPAAVAGPSASTEPSRASSAARGGSVVRRLSSSPSRSPGKVSEGDHRTRASPSRGPGTIGRRKRSESVPNRRVCTLVATTSTPSAARSGAPGARSPAASLRGAPTTRSRSAVAVISASRYACANSLGVTARCEAGASSAYMLA